MAVNGIFASDAGIVGDRKGDFAAALLQIMPTGTAPFLALTSGMESADAGDIVITWFEENHLAGRATVTNDASTSGTTFTVDDASWIVPGMVFMVEAGGEFVFVTAVSGSNLTVVRAFAGTTAEDVDGAAGTENIQRIGTAFEEGSSRPTAVANLGYPRFNYMQIFRNAWDVTGTAKRIEFHTGDVVAKNRRDAAVFHAEDIERSLLWGRKTIGIQNSKPFRTMDGVLTQITTNVSTQSTNVDADDLYQFLLDVFNRNIKGKPNERIAFCGNTVVNVINKIGRLDGVENMEPGATEFGMKVTKWLSPFGDISLMTHPLMNESPLWTKDLFLLHPGAVRVRYLRRTSEDDYDQDGTRAGADSDFGVLTTELSVEYRAEITGGKYTGIDTAAATS